MARVEIHRETRIAPARLDCVDHRLIVGKGDDRILRAMERPDRHVLQPAGVARIPQAADRSDRREALGMPDRPAVRPHPTHAEPGQVHAVRVYGKLLEQLIQHRIQCRRIEALDGVARLG